MAQAAQKADSDDGQQTFTNRPTVVADNGHGTRVKLWNNDGKNGEFQNVTIERSFKREGSDQWETRKVSLNASDLLLVARGLEGNVPRLSILWLRRFWEAIPSVNEFDCRPN